MRPRRNIRHARQLTSAFDAVDGSSTGTLVPLMWVLLVQPRFVGANHAGGHNYRSRFAKSAFQLAERRATRAPRRTLSVRATFPIGLRFVERFHDDLMRASRRNNNSDGRSFTDFPHICGSPSFTGLFCQNEASDRRTTLMEEVLRVDLEGESMPSGHPRRNYHGVAFRASPRDARSDRRCGRCRPRRDSSRTAPR